MIMPRTFNIAFLSTILVVLSSLHLGNGIQTEAVAGNNSGPLLYTHYGAMMLNDLAGSVPGPDQGCSEYWIVQFDGPITGKDLSALRNTGVQVLDYFPDFAFVVHLNGRSASVLERIDGVVGISPYLSGLKVSPAMLPMLFASDQWVVDLLMPDPDAVRMISEGYIIDEVASDTRLIVRSTQDPMGLAAIDGIKWIEPRADHALFNDVSAGLMDVVPVWNDLGLDGTGQTIAISDTGLDTGVDKHNVTGDIHLDFDNRARLRNWAGSSPDDTHGHGTHVAGSVGGSGARSSGTFRGMAYNSTIFFQAIADDSGNLQTPGNLSLLFKESYDAGARVHTNSWGSGWSALFGAYTSECYDVDWSMFHYPELLILFAAGNDGADGNSNGKIDPGSVSPPATAKSTLTVGASENVRSSGGLQMTWGAAWGYPSNPIANDMVSNNSRGLAAFSSRGPTDDNRIKPEIVAPGTNILSARSSLAPAWNYWGILDNYYGYMGGTSMATPLTAGLAGLVRQYFTDVENVSNPLGSLIKAAIINGGFDMTPGQYGAGNPTTKEVRSRPDNDQGWGRADLEGAVDPDGGRISFFQDTAGFRTGDNTTRWVKVGPGSDFRTTLAWADYPGDPAATKQLVNDLDLMITAPNGSVYRGNDITKPHDSTWDRVNPTETVTIKKPAIGWWKVEVQAYNVPKGPQHFALVASGNISDLLTNSLRFDRAYYSTDDALVTIEMIALEMHGQGTVQVKVNSTSDPSGIDLTMSEYSEGLFRATFRTSNSTTEDPNRLFVRHNDTILTNYSRPSFGFDFKATSVAVRPIRAYLYPDRDHLLEYSLFDRIWVKVLSQKGAALEWTMEGAGIPEMRLYDNGDTYYGDTVQNDGNYSGFYLINRPTHASYRIVLFADDPYLGRLTYPQISISIDTDMPRFPRGLSGIPLDEGNGVLLGWDPDNVSDRSHFDLYVNKTATEPILDPSGWAKISEVAPRRVYTEVLGLTDNVSYSFRIASINLTGKSSSLSSWATIVPRDIIAPDVRMLDRPKVLSDVSRFDFESDPDTKIIEMEFAYDLDKDNVPDGNFSKVGATGTNVMLWDTRSSSGGPGNVSSLMLRYRAFDEVPNNSSWIEKAGFSIDNVPPPYLRILGPIEPLTKRPHHSFLGETEAFSSIVIMLNGGNANDVQASGEGKFSFSIELDEGRNVVELLAKDQNGAGPIRTSFEMTLDTNAPSSLIRSDLPEIIDISGTIYHVASDSFDPGMSPFNNISNLTWELKGPLGLIKVHYGNSSMTVRFEEIGQHRIRLIVTDLAGNQNETELKIQVTDRIIPTPSIVGPGIVDEDTFVFYLPGPDIDNDPYMEGSMDGFLWHFSGGENWTRDVAMKNGTIIFPEPGIYNVTLRVTDRMNNQGYSRMSILVKDITAPEVMITGQVNVYSGTEAEYTFEATDNDPAFNDTWNATWTLSFIDDPNGTPPLNFTGRSFAFEFRAIGNYSIALRVSDAEGNIGTADLRVRVYDNAINDRDGNGDGFPYLLISIGALIVLAAAGAVVFIYIKNRPEISDVDWEDDDWEDLDDE
jgi:subtilisin family serine protease